MERVVSKGDEHGAAARASGSRGGIRGHAIAIGLIAAPALAADLTLAIEGFAYSPKTVTVSVGDRVTWRNHDGVPRTATASGDFDTGNIGPGASRGVTFKAAGTYPSEHDGTVIVCAAAVGGSAPNTDLAPADPGDGGTIAPQLALLGAVMVAVTLIAGRSLRRRTAR